MSTRARVIGSVALGILVWNCGGSDDSGSPASPDAGVAIDAGKAETSVTPPTDSGADVSKPIDSSVPDTSVVDAPVDAPVDTGPACNSPCSTNPGANNCIAGVLICDDAGTHCADGQSGVADGTTCTTGQCNRGKCEESIVLPADIDLTQGTITTGRTCAEALAYNVVGLTSTTATISPGATSDCLGPGDEVILINMQGTPTDSASVGTWELLTVDSVASLSTVTFKSAKTKHYGSPAGSDTGVGTGTTDQKVVLMRVPHYGSLTIPSGKTLSSMAWNGTRGGILVLRAGSITVDGTISATGLGYNDGRWSRDDGQCNDNVATEAGESINGPPVAGTANQVGGAGGLSAVTGLSFNSNSPINSGSSHATVGEIGKNPNGRTIGPPGVTYGAADASRLTMGSGASGNLTCENNFAGPVLVPTFQHLAGGIVLLMAGRIDVSATGSITATAGTAARDVSASGGYVYLEAPTLALDTGRVTAKGGVATSVNGPVMGQTVKAGDGYIVLKGTTVTGTTDPAANQL